MRRERSLVVSALLVGVLAAVLSLAGCGAQGGSGCEPVDARAPNGRPLDLTGEWTGNDQGRYLIKQVGSCVWWVGLSEYPGEDPGATWANVFRGTLAADRTVTGEFTDVRSPDKATGTLTLRVEDARRGGVVLRRESVEGAAFGGNFWERARDE